MRLTVDQPGERLDVAVARLAGVSRAQAQKLIIDGFVQAEGGTRIKAGERLNGDEVLIVRVPAPVAAEPQPESLPLDILYEDGHLLVIDKPAGLPVHPGPGHPRSTLVNALLAHCPDLPGINGVQRPGIVHRLDKDTSGLMVVAKDEAAHRGLSAQLKDREMRKTYLTLVEGRLEPREALIDAPIARDPNNRRRMMVRAAGGRDAQTRFRVRTYYQGSSLDKGSSLVEATLLTGRTHQIRVHFASLGHPVIGDVVYGRSSTLVGRQFLHSWRLAFEHPIDGRPLSFGAPLPDDLQTALSRLSPAG